MAGSVNKVILVGNLGADPEIKRTQDGRPIANLSVATSDTWRDKNTGERKEKTEWHRVVIFSEGLCKITLEGHQELVRCVRFNDTHIVSGSYDKTVRIWDFHTGASLRVLGGPSGEQVCLLHRVCFVYQHNHLDHSKEPCAHRAT